MANGKPDIRLDLGMPDHLKTKRLIRSVGHEGFYCLIRLWCYAAKHRPKGVLTGMDVADIEDAAGWTGQRGALHAALLDARWIDTDCITLHDWEDEQPWVAGREARSAHSKALADKRWDARRIAERNAERIAVGNAPIPSPSPSPLPPPMNIHGSGPSLRGPDGRPDHGQRPPDSGGEQIRRFRQEDAQGSEPAHAAYLAWKATPGNEGKSVGEWRATRGVSDPVTQ